MTIKPEADATLQLWEGNLEPDQAGQLQEAEALIEALAQRSESLVHDMSNGLTRMLGRTNLAMEAMVDEGAPSLDDLEALRGISRELANLSHALRRDVVVPARKHVRSRKVC